MGWHVGGLFLCLTHRAEVLSCFCACCGYNLLNPRHMTCSLLSLHTPLAPDSPGVSYSGPHPPWTEGLTAGPGQYRRVSLGRTPGPIQTAEEEQCTLGNKTVIGRHTRGLWFQKAAWGDGHNWSLMLTVKSHLSLNLPRACEPSLNADLPQLNKQTNCSGLHLRF